MISFLRLVQRAASAAALLLAAVTAAPAQTTSANIAGRALEAETSSLLPGSRVRLVELERETVTARDGSFTFSNLPAGTYTVVAAYLGYDEARATVTLTPGPGQPFLPDLTRHALRTLDAQANGFFLMIEGTQADWAGHQNDPAMLVHELLEFDAAVAAVQAHAAGRDDTLVIVLSDHGCGGLGVGNLRSQADRRTGLPPESLIAPLRHLRTSTVALREKHGIMQSPDVPTIRRLVGEHWGVSLSVAQAEEILVADRNPHRDEDCDGIGRVFCRDFTYLDWTTHEHTAEDVPLFASGPGAPRGTLHLTDLNAAMVQALGLTLA